MVTRRSLRQASACLLAALLVASCSQGTDETTTTTTTTTTPVPATCPNGTALPAAAPEDLTTPGPPPTTDPPTAPGGDGTLDLGVLLPLSGDLAFLGPAPAAAISLAVDDLEAAGGVLDGPITVRLADAAPEVEGTASAEVTAFLDAGVDVIVGPMTSGVAVGVLDQVARSGGVLVSPASTSAALDRIDAEDRFFRTAPSEVLQGRALAELVLDDGWSTVSIAARDDAYGTTIADAVADRVVGDGGAVAARVAYDPTDSDLGAGVIAGLDLSADAVIIVGLTESARIVDALVLEGHGPRDRAVYGTDGNLGDRLADLVADPSSLACMSGVLPFAAPTEELADRLRSARPDLGSLDHAAEAYDAVVITALAAQLIGSDDGQAIATAMPGVTRDGTACATARDCLDLARAGTDLAYEGAAGALRLDDEGNPTTAEVTLVTFDGAGRLARLGTRTVTG